MHRLAVVAVLLLPAVATADPEPASVYVQGGVGFGVVSVKQSFGGPGYQLATAVRLGDLWIRGALNVQTMLISDGGQMYEPHGGVEWRTSGNAGAALFGGIDVGFVSGSAMGEDGGYTLSGEFAMPQGGLDFGGDDVRFYVGIGILLGHGTSTDSGAPAGQTSTTGFEGGFNFDLGLIVR